MYPNFVLGLGHDTTDAQVAERYRALVVRYPPDRAPEQFSAIRGAYEKLRTERDRAMTWLDYTDKTGNSLTDEIPCWLASRPRATLSEGALAELIRGGWGDGRSSKP